MLKKQVLMGVAIVTAALVTAGSAEASCKQGFCMQGYDDANGIHHVEFTTSISNYTHFNIWDGRQQRQIGRNERYI